MGCESNFSRIYKELISEDASIWFVEDSSELFFMIKAPINTVKAIIEGCRIELLIGKDTNLGKTVIHTGIRVYDDPNHCLLLTGTNRHLEDNQSLIKVLEQQSCTVGLYNEIGICVSTSILNINEKNGKIALNFIGNISELYTGEFDNRIKKSLDCFDYTLDPSRNFKEPYKIDVIKFDCVFNTWNPTLNHFVGLNEQEETIINQKEEGQTLEKHVWFPIENIFNFGIYKNPKYKTPHGEKEMTDILASYDLGLFLIETKSLSVFFSKDGITMDKKVVKLKKHIQKGINQLVGAKNNILKGTEIFNSNSDVIDINRNTIPHCIVIVSELLPFGDWKDIEDQILKTMKEESIFLNVMDFREFMNIVKNSKGSKEHLDYYLIRRAEGFIKTKSIHMRVNITRETI